VNVSTGGKRAETKVEGSTHHILGYDNLTGSLCWFTGLWICLVMCISFVQGLVHLANSLTVDVPREGREFMSLLIQQLNTQLYPDAGVEKLSHAPMVAFQQAFFADYIPCSSANPTAEQLLAQRMFAFAELFQMQQDENGIDTLNMDSQDAAMLLFNILDQLAVIAKVPTDCFAGMNFEEKQTTMCEVCLTQSQRTIQTSRVLTLSYPSTVPGKTLAAAIGEYQKLSPLSGDNRFCCSTCNQTYGPQFTNNPLAVPTRPLHGNQEWKFMRNAGVILGVPQSGFRVFTEATTGIVVDAKVSSNFLIMLRSTDANGPIVDRRFLFEPTLLVNDRWFGVQSFVAQARRHFVTFVFDKETNSWTCVNDSVVTKNLTWEGVGRMGFHPHMICFGEDLSEIPTREELKQARSYIESIHGSDSIANLPGKLPSNPTSHSLSRSPSLDFNCLRCLTPLLPPFAGDSSGSARKTSKKKSKKEALGMKEQEKARQAAILEESNYVANQRAIKQTSKGNAVPASEPPFLWCQRFGH
jgi:hypothetical protein